MHASSAIPPLRERSGEPSWRPLRQFTSDRLPAATRVWLTDDGSLTARLISLNAGTFRVQRLYQGWEVPRLSERVLLDMPDRRLSMVREVVLTLAGTPVVFARSVFPFDTLTGNLGHLRRLRNKSLGAILFRHPNMHRRPFELALMPGNSRYIPAHLHQTRPAWGRRSRFDIEAKQLLVSEVFLDTFTPWRAVLPVHRSQRGRVSAAIVRPNQ
ncbi:MAG: chorismate lyase [Pseudomonadota bacterium]